MRWPFVGALFLCALSAGRLPAFDVQAVIKSVDLGEGRLHVTALGQDRAIPITGSVKVFNAAGEELADGLKSAELKAGANVTLTLQRDGNRPVLQAIRIGTGTSTGGRPKPQPASPERAAEPRLKDTSSLVPLSELGTEKYQGFEGGLYPGGKNARPSQHEAAGEQLAAQVRPLDASGQPSGDGKIGLLTVGFSNTQQCSRGFIEVAAQDKYINPHVAVVNGAQGGRSAFMIQNPKDGAVGEQYWNRVVEQLREAGLTPAQVQAVWLKETDASLNPGQLKTMGLPAYQSPLLQGFPTGQKTYQAELKRIVQAIHTLLPHVKLVYVSSRSFGGWAVPGGGNGEPWSYETAFGVKWLVEEQINGDSELNYDPAKGPVKAPWLSWGPYLWANGTKPRSDGFCYAYEDYRDNDHMHHSEQGMRKMGHVLVDFFKTDSTTRTWFVGRSE
ncbi:MAG TPA: hypothetical protein VHZ24_17150 [Pirellulales bacterium]|nr:hypothetical protein [Pirellulales bacterium]